MVQLLQKLQKLLVLMDINQQI